MARAWLIRAGEDASALDEMRHAGVIAVRYPQIQVDARTMASEEIERLIKESGRTQPGVRRVRLEWFVHDIAVGDLVITPNAADHEVWFAEVSSDYRYEVLPAVPGYFHVRGVNWLGAMDRDLLPDDRRIEVSARPTIIQDLDHDWWRQIATSAAAHTNRQHSKRLNRSAGPSTSAKRVPLKPMVLCNNPDCGMQYAATSMVDGLCPECCADR